MGCAENSKKIIQYKYKDVVITRINDYPRDIFYCGKFDTVEELPDNYVLSEFSGFDGLMSAFLIFKKDRTVEIILVADDFTQVGENPSLILNKTIENIDFIHWRDQTMSDLDSIIQVSDGIRLEIERNKKEHSKVTARYDTALFK